MNNNNKNNKLSDLQMEKKASNRGGGKAKSCPPSKMSIAYAEVISFRMRKIKIPLQNESKQRLAVMRSIGRVMAGSAITWMTKWDAFALATHIHNIKLYICMCENLYMYSVSSSKNQKKRKKELITFLTPIYDNYSVKVV